MSSDRVNELLQRASDYVHTAHHDQSRKGKLAYPYVFHPLETGFIASTMTDDEDVIVAAILHDVIEDAHKTRDDIEKDFGKKVADLVASESEDKRPDRPASDTWKERKAETIEDLRKASIETVIICLSDKLSNIRSSYFDFVNNGSSFWEKFNVKDPNLQCWYYATLGQIFSTKLADKAAYKEYRRYLDLIFGEDMVDKYYKESELVK